MKEKAPMAPGLDGFAQESIFPFWKGRVALYAILQAMEIGPADVVIIPGYTCMVVPSAVFFVGARPIYADVDPTGFNVTQKTLEEAWRKFSGPRPKAVIIQHTYGIPVEAGPILEWARDEGLAIIEDCAHSLGASYRGIPCGQLGAAAFFSSQWSKPVTTGLGGWAVSNQIDLSRRLQRIWDGMPKPTPREAGRLLAQFFCYSLTFRPRFYWPLMNLYRSLSRQNITIGSSSPEELDLQMPSRYALRMAPFQEKLLKKALAQAAHNLAHRQKLSELYKNELQMAGWENPKVPENSLASFVRYPVKVKDKKRLLHSAQKARLEIGDWFLSPLHPLLEDWEKLDYRQGDCPVAEELCQRVVNLPTHARITPEQAKRIVEMVLNEQPG